MKYQNPIIRGFNPDPSICRKGKDYYLATSSFEFLPGLPIYHSRDLIHWTHINYALNRPEQMEFDNCFPNAGIFAPTIRYHEGWFYITTTNVARPGAFAPGGSGNFIIRTQDPAGEWSEPMWIDQGGIDPDLFFDDDGRVYFSSTTMYQDEDGHTTSATQMSQIDLQTGEKLTESRIIELKNTGRHAEGPHIYKKNGYYYMLRAEGGTESDNHMATIARAVNVWGPYERCPHNPILSTAILNEPALHNPGHADIIEDHNGHHWIVFLCSRIADGSSHHIGRETSIAPVDWTGEWPVVNNFKPPTDHMESDHLPDYCPIDPKPVRTLFNTDRLSLDWVSVRTYFKGYQLDGPNGVLQLYGNEHTLNDKATPAFLGYRQRDFECRMETAMSFMPQAENEEAGITLFRKNDAYMSLVLTKRNDKNVVLLRRRCVDMVTEQYSEPVDTSELRLKIIADRYYYRFYYVVNEQEYFVGQARARMLSSEVVDDCIGLFVGPYASGNGKACTTPAVYHWFDYETLPELPKKARFDLYVELT